MAHTFDVIVVGAGYIGCSAAYYLCKAGLRTALIDQYGIGGAASSANFGNIQVVDCELDHSIPMIREGYTRFDRLEEELGADFHRHAIGSLLLIESENQWQIMAERQKVVQSSGIKAELYPASALPGIEPLIDPASLLGALYSPVSAQVCPFAFMWAFINRASRMGLALFTGTSLNGFIIKGDAIQGVTTSRGDFYAPCVVLATGAWTRKLGNMIGLDWPVHFIHGQAFASAVPGIQFENHFSSASFFEKAHESVQTSTLSVALAMAQSVHGNILMGEATRHGKDHDFSVTPDAPAAISNQVVRFFPKLRNLTALHAWAAPVAYTDDGLPFLGTVAAIRGLVLATAFKSTVIVTPLAGETVARMVTGAQLDLDISCFSPDRFDRDCKRGTVA